MQSVFPYKLTTISLATCAASGYRRTLVAAAATCLAWPVHAGSEENAGAREQLTGGTGTKLVAGTSVSTDPEHRRRELSDALEKAAEAERRLKQKAEQLNADMARLLNQPETQKLLQPAPVVGSAPVPVAAPIPALEHLPEPLRMPAGPLRLRMDRALAHSPEATGNGFWPTTGATGIAAMLASGSAMVAAAAMAWLIFRARTLRRADQARRKAWTIDTRLKQEKAPALLIHETEG
jgi:hypothetical protein